MQVLLGRTTHLWSEVEMQQNEANVSQLASLLRGGGVPTVPLHRLFSGVHVFLPFILPRTARPHTVTR